jgi:hypothetical protein
LSQIDIITEPNPDGTLNYFSWRYKNVWVKIGLGYQNGVLNKILIPAYLNLSQADVAKLIMQLYIERIDFINTINTINTVNLINTITSIGTIGSIGKLGVTISTPNLIRNGDFSTGDFSFWGNNAAVIVSGYCTFNAIGNSVQQDVPSFLAPNCTLSLNAFCKNGVEQGTVTFVYTDASTEAQTFTCGLVPQIVTFVPASNKRLATVEIAFTANAGVLSVSNIQLVNDVAVNLQLYADNSSEPSNSLVVVPKAKGKTTIDAVNISSGAAVTVYTVPAGKTFYLTQMTLMASGSLTFSAVATANGVQKGIIGAQQAATLTEDLTPNIPMPYPANATFTVAMPAGGATGDAWLSLSGWLE